MSLKEHRCRKS